MDEAVGQHRALPAELVFERRVVPDRPLAGESRRDQFVPPFALSGDDGVGLEIDADAFEHIRTWRWTDKKTRQTSERTPEPRLVGSQRRKNTAYRKYPYPRCLIEIRGPGICFVV